MSTEPSTDNVDFFLSITNSVSKSDAVKWLKHFNNDVNSACNAYYENPNSLDAWDNTGSQAWDDTAWAQGKEYGPQNQNQNVPSFTVTSEDTLNPKPFDGTISRPPSRVSNLGNGDKPTGQSSQKTAEEREEAQIAKAMEMSLGDSGQESGVVDESGTSFRPATRPTYPQNDWTMTHIGSAQEILQNPEPQYRKREKGAPAFVRPNPTGDYLPALLTILHAIPMAREALLLRDYTLPDYGHDNEWWDGLSIHTPKVVNLDEPDQDHDWAGVIYESQRLMAFLDGTDRAYGNADPLAHVEGMAWSSESIESTFLNTWKEAAVRATSESDLAHLFETTAFFREQGDKSISVIDLNTYNADRGFSIYDVFDNAFYYGLDHTDEAYFKSVAEVLVIHVNKNSASMSGHGMRVPSIFYADRYLKEAATLSQQMRMDKEAVRKEIDRIEEVQSNITKLKQDSFMEIDAIKLLNITKTYLQSPPTLTDLIDIPSGDSIADKVATYSKLAEELQAIAERVQRKFEAMEDSKAQALDKLRDLSKVLTKPSADPDLSPNKKYTLRGVSTNHNTTYVLEKTRPEDEDDLLSAEACDWQWWKIQFSSGDTKPITYTKVREVEVMKAAKDESASTLLVYASEKAISFESRPPPQQLCNFVRADNLEFNAELSRAIASQGSTSPKRKAAESYDETDNTDDINWGGYQSTPPKKVNGFSVPEPIEDMNNALPPPYTPSKPPAPPPRSAFSRSSAYKSRKSLSTSYDDMIPTSLRATGPTIDSSSTTLVDVELNEKPVVGPEMKERSSRLGVKSGVGGTSQAASGYKLGSYVPEIDMDGVDEGFAEGKGG